MNVRTIVLVCALPACGNREVPEIPANIVGSCRYTNRFSGKPECRDYHGAWTDEALREDCADWSGVAELGEPCDIDDVLGHCVLGGEGGAFVRVNIPGADAGDCGSSQRGCELFGGGVFDAAPICGGEPKSTSGGGLPTFLPPVRRCVDARPGEPMGQTAGKVCTWEMISGATEDGRAFADYASCDRVRTQRPYYSYPAAEGATGDDPRLGDRAYATELAWVKRQITAAACVCCHSSTAPKGPANWFFDAPGNFANGFFPRGLAMGAGWIDTVGFGAYPPEENNGFTRATPDNPTHPIFPTTDPARMRRFFEGELRHRGIGREKFAGMPYGAGPLDEQRFFRPSPCARGEGVEADGRVVWKGGRARYLYVLDAEAASPTVPPNLDLPSGARWRIDVPPEGTPLRSGEVTYGAVPGDASQRFPASGAPAALVAGTTYYLYVTADVIQPITRCTFVAK